MFTILQKRAACAGVLWLFSSVVIAGSFTLESGATITSTSVSIGWTSTASEQWIRAYNSSGVVLFDSGRQSASSGQVRFTVLASETQLRVIFYEKDGDWVANERTYSVSIDGTNGSSDTLANLSCTTNQIARYDGSRWVCSNDSLVDVLDPTIAEILMRLELLESAKIYRIGDVGPAGGRVFYVSNGGQNGLEAAPGDQDEVQWCSIDTINILGVADISSPFTRDPHSGALNTPLIVSVCGASSAAGVAAAYVWPKGQSDGFLPNKEELDLLNAQRAAVGGFSESFYWSSTEAFVSPDLNAQPDLAWAQSFGGRDGTLQDFSGKTSIHKVRAVRAF